MANKILICKTWFTTVDMHVSNKEFLWLKLFKGEAYKPNILYRRELAFFFPLELMLIYTRFLSTRYASIYNHILNLNFILLKTNELL